MQDHYFTIEKQASAEFKDRGSRFIAFAFPINDPSDFKLSLKQLRKDHPKAVHHCFAYRLGISGLEYRAVDDGEPSGSAGKPILGQIDSYGLTNVAVVVVRYFGGTLLGVPGLINAYKSVTSLALQGVPIIRKEVEFEYEIQFDYSVLNPVMQILKNYHCSIDQQQMQIFCVLKVRIPEKCRVEVISELKKLKGVDANKIV